MIYEEMSFNNKKSMQATYITFVYTIPTKR